MRDDGAALTSHIMRVTAGASVSREATWRAELDVVGEIAHAFLTASRPIEVFRVALDRVTPLVGAQFSSVFLRDETDPSLLRLACAHNWPQIVARHLGTFRIRAGRGPTGRAVVEAREVEVENVFEESSLREWWDAAKELGVVGLMALPLAVDNMVAGALTFYYRAPHRFDDAERRLLRLIADQLAATASHAFLIEELRQTNERLRVQNDELSLRVQEAEEAKRLKDEFLANVSHELRTPLTSILGYAHLLESHQLGPLTEKQRSAIVRIGAGGQTLLRLITDLLDLVRLKLERVAVLPAEHDAVRLAHAAAEEVGPAPEGVSFAVRGEATMRVVTDAEKVVRILTNLLSNAYKFTPSGHIELVVTAHQDQPGPVVEWTVRDTGIGIPLVSQDAIFDEFRQVDGSATRPYGGTGLGLALSRRLAKLLNGDVRVVSEPGRGSAFTLRVPVRPLVRG
jgi:signal transduction histidine kinase